MLKNYKRLTKDFHKHSPYKLIMYERYRQNEAMKGKHYTNTQWLSLLTEQLGTLSFLLHQENENRYLDEADLEPILIKLSALSMTWIEELRKK